MYWENTYLIFFGFLLLFPYSQSFSYHESQLGSPLNGTLKINVHATSFKIPMPNGNTSGIGVMLRISNGNLLNCIGGTIPNLTALAA